MNRVARYQCLYAWSVLPAAFSTTTAAAEWHHPLYLDGGGYWRQRTGVVIENGTEHPLDGRPVAVRVGAGLLGSPIRAKSSHRRGISGPISKKSGIS